MIKRGLLGDIHSIRAEWNRSNLPPPDKDSWKMPLPPNTKDEEATRKLEEDVKKCRQLLPSSYGKDAELCSRRLAQLQAQLEDKILNTIDKRPGARWPRRWAIRARK